MDVDVDVLKRFLVGFHPEVTIKSHDYHVAMQFVLLAFGLGREADIREIEEANGMKTGVISHTCWIKPMARRSSSQTCRHAIFSFTLPQSANDMLANGLFIHQKKVYAEKCKKRSPCIV